MRKHATPGVAVALIEDGEIARMSGYGVTDEGGPPVTPDTVFQAASLGKPVFAHLLATLEPRRPWSLDSPLAGWTDPLPLPPAFESSSAERILSHTAAVRYDEELGRLVIDEDLVGQWQYSGPGYVALQLTLEAAESARLEKIARASLLGPLGLKNMGYLPPSDAETAGGHDRSGAPIRLHPWERANAGSSLHSSARAYARFLVEASAPRRATPPAAWSRLTTPMTTVREDLGFHWGLGWALEAQPDGSMAAFHWGSNPGFKSFAMMDRTRGFGVVILTNGDNGLELAEEAVGIVDPRPHPLFEFYMLHPDD